MDVIQKPDLVALAPGAAGYYGASAVTIRCTVGPDKLLVVSKASDEPFLIGVDDFRIRATPTHAPRPAIHDQSEEWREAERRYEIIAPLVARDAPEGPWTAKDVQACADRAGRHITTIYRWIRAYENSGGRVSALKPGTKSRGSRRKLLGPETEALMQAAIEQFYLNQQQFTLKYTHERLTELCAAAGKKPPHYNTLRKRVDALPKRQRLARRARTKEASDTYTPRPGTFAMERPWQLVEMDSTPLDVLVVDEVHRKHIGKANLTAAIDVYSRMIVGYYISLEPVSAASAGLCLKTAMLPKGRLLSLLGAKIDWPCHGRPVSLHVDNGMEHRAFMLYRACHEYRIALEFRPLKTPEFGGHIESFFKTLSRKVHELSGSTFSNPQHRAEYPSEEKACMTLDALERWIVRAIGEYHEAFHSEIKTSPLSRYRRAYASQDDQLPLAMPEVFEYPERVEIDFLPFVEQKIHQYGFHISGIKYFNHVLVPFINAEGRNGQKQKFRVHYDPRDMSKVYFYHPELKQYFGITYRFPSHPRMSKWELDEVRKTLNKQGRENVNEREIVRLIKERREIEVESAKSTRRARRNTERVRAADSLPKLVAVPAVPMRATRELLDAPRIRRPYATEDL